MQKSDLRKQMLSRRLALSRAEIVSESSKVMKNLFSDYDFLRASSVGFYFPHKGEIDTTEMIKRSLLFGKTSYLPKILPGHSHMMFCEFSGFENMEKGKYGIMEPIGGEFGEPEVLLVPGIAFDLHKHRLGFGKGYYDRYLRQHDALSIGVCYGWQVVDKIPRESHDMQMDKIIAGDWILE